MRLSDLLESEVLDSEGKPVGQVHDVRFVREGPVQGSFGPAYRLQGLVVGGASIGSRLGFGRGNVKGPYPLKKLFSWFHGSGRFVAWPQVSSVEEDVIRLNVKESDLPSVPQLPQ